MDRAFTLALAAAIVNVVLSTLIPCIMKNVKAKSGNILSEIKVSFIINRHMLLTSSIVTAILVYLSVKIEPEVAAMNDNILNFITN